MTTSYPSGLDNRTRPAASDTLGTTGVKAFEFADDVLDMVEALEAKVGVDSSAVATSHDYKIAQLERGGRLFKARAGIATNVTLASAVENGDTLDGVVLATGDVVALLGQTTGADNGLYTVAASGAPTRIVAFDASAEVLSGSLISISEGTANKDSIWQLTTNATITLGTTSLVFFPVHLQGTGSPEAVVTAPIGATFRRTDGSTGTTLYIKESGTGNTGWVAVAASGSSGLTKIAESTLGASGTFSFTSIPGTYRSLMLVFEGSSSAAVVNSLLQVRFNADVGSNYDSQRVEATGTADTWAASAAASRFLLGRIPGASAGANKVGAATLIVPDYAGTTWHKTILAEGLSAETAGTTLYLTKGVGRQANTAAVTQIDITSNDGDLATASRCTLYGLST